MRIKNQLSPFTIQKRFSYALTMSMINSSLAMWGATGLYCLASAGALHQLLSSVRGISSTAEDSSNPLGLSRWPLSIGVLAWCAHCVYAGSLAFDYSESVLTLNLSVTSMSALISAFLVATFLLLCSFMTLSRLAVIVFPLTIASLLFSHFWSLDSSQSVVIARGTSTSLKLHILTSILAYTFITISTIQSLVYRFQEAQLKKRVKAKLMAALPPLETMESLVFRLLLIGFILLSITLISGSLFSQTLFGVSVEFTHHTVFALLAWILSARVIYARAIAGMSGGQAMPWIIGAFLCIQLGYFGSKIIWEILN